MFEMLVFSRMTIILLSLAMGFALIMGWLVYRQDHPFRGWHSLIVSFGFLLPVILFLVAVVLIGVNVPYWDDYDVFLRYLVIPPSERVLQIFNFHNEHRIFTTRVVGEIVYLENGAMNFKYVMYVGNAILLLLLGLFVSRFRGIEKRGWLFFMPCLWLFLDLLNHQNMFWALTSVQSNSVLLFGFLALVSLDRGPSWGWLLTGLFCAFLCTYSSGSGVLIWPCMAGLLVADRFFRVEPRLWKGYQVTAFILVALVSLGGYFRGFAGKGGESNLSVLIENPLRVIDFFLTFCGGASPLRFPALALGVAIAGLILYLGLRFSRVRDYPAFFFLLFLLGAGISAAVFRSQEGIENALSSRYRVVAVSIFSSAMLLSLDAFRTPSQWRSVICAFLCTGAIALNLSSSILSWHLQLERSEKLVNNILLWPDTDIGLRSPDVDQASQTLDKAVESGVYNPTVLQLQKDREDLSFMPW